MTVTESTSNQGSLGPLIAPSILSADFAKLGAEVAEVEQAGAEWIHVDVMDGHYVPNITIGPLVVEAVRRSTGALVDVHLMIEPVDLFVADFVSAGADIVTVHVEACPHLDRTLSLIRDLGAKAGVSLNPSTPVSTLRHVVDKLDLILIMSVNPGFGGQAYIPEAETKIADARALLASAGRPEVLVEVDGGISVKTAGSVVAAGADVLVAGSAIFGQPDRAAAITALRSAAQPSGELRR